MDYSQHNQNGELDLYDANTAPNGMSEQYLTDRASFLVAAVQAGVENATISADKIYYLDAASGLELQPFELVQKYDNTGLPYWEELPVAGAPRYIFGSNNGDTYDGRFYNVVQHVYGGAGDDSIKTGGGTDHLDSGTGRNILEGGRGFDTYVLQDDGSPDIIRDEDGQGVIRVGKEAVRGAFTNTKERPDLFSSADGRWQLRYGDSEAWELSQKGQDGSYRVVARLAG